MDVFKISVDIEIQCAMAGQSCSTVKYSQEAQRALGSARKRIGRGIGCASSWGGAFAGYPRLQLG